MLKFKVLAEIIDDFIKIRDDLQKVDWIDKEKIDAVNAQIDSAVNAFGLFVSENVEPEAIEILKSITENGETAENKKAEKESTFMDFRVPADFDEENFDALDDIE